MLLLVFFYYFEVKVTWQKTFLHITVRQPETNITIIDSCSIFLKKLILQKFLRMYDKSNTFILASLCTNPSGKGRKEFRVERVWEKCWHYLCRNCYDFAWSKPLLSQRYHIKNLENEHTIDRILIKHLKRSIYFQNY